MDLELWKPTLVSMDPRFSISRSLSGNGAAAAPRSPTRSAPAMDGQTTRHQRREGLRKDGQEGGREDIFTGRRTTRYSILGGWPKCHSLRKCRGTSLLGPSRPNKYHGQQREGRENGQPMSRQSAKTKTAIVSPLQPHPHPRCTQQVCAIRAPLPPFPTSHRR